MSGFFKGFVDVAQQAVYFWMVAGRFQDPEQVRREMQEEIRRLDQEVAARQATAKRASAPVPAVQTQEREPIAA